MGQQLLSTDPKAGELLSTDPNAGAAPQSVGPRDARGLPAVSSNTSDAPASGIARWFNETLRPQLEQVAHPKTISDIAALLIPDAGVTATVRAGARGTMALGRGVERVAQSPAVTDAARMAGTAGAAGEIFHGAPGTAAAIATGASVAPKAAAMTGRGLQRAGAALERATVETPATPPIRGAALPNQKALNEAALAARRAAYQARSTTPSPVAVAEPIASVPAAPASPGAPVARTSGPLPQSESLSPSVAPARVTVPVAQSKEYLRLRSTGKTHQQAVDLIQAQLELAKKMGLPTTAEVKAAVKERNALGQWETPTGAPRPE